MKAKLIESVGCLQKPLRLCTRNVALFGSVAVLNLAGCSPSDLIDTDVPSGTNDPRAYNTAEGALLRYRGLISSFRQGVSGGTGSQLGFIATSSLISDELIAAQANSISTSGSTAANIALDSRNLDPESRDGAILQVTASAWIALHKIRLAAIDAIGALHNYAPQSPPDRIGHAFALWGMSEVMLAELYCSGIPLSRIEFSGGAYIASGSTTEEVYNSALKLFDSALVYASDSFAYRHLAMVGKGWALLGLNRYSEAAAAVAEVPVEFVYNNLHVSEGSGLNFTYYQPGRLSDISGVVSDREGIVGLPYISAADPRLDLIQLPSDASLPGVTGFMVRNFVQPSSGAGPVTIASGIEARLIRAEYELSQGGNAWLNTLNDLRSSAGVAGLAPLTDPGADARVDTLFKERAFWLFLTGRRHGDMRRLVRQYGKPIGNVFPRGPYVAHRSGAYGTAVVLPAPITERDVNTSYSGCFHTNA